MQQTVQSPSGRLPSMAAPHAVASLLLALVASLPFVLWSVLPVGSTAQSPGQIQKKIDRNHSLIGGHKAARAGADERHLRPDAPDQHPRRATSRGSPTASRSCRRASTRKRAELAIVQRKLREERARLTRLRARLLVVRRALAQRLVELYKADAPDAITVVLESEGFADLLTRTEFMERVSRQDAKIMDIVAEAKADATATAKRLTRSRSARRGSPSRSSPSATRSRRSASGSSTAATASSSARSTKVTLLASSRERRHELQDDVEQLQAQQAKIQAKLAGFAGTATAGPIKPGSGGMIWPVNGPLTSPFCESRSWESCHPGIDIAVPAGTPIRAAAPARSC